MDANLSEDPRAIIGRRIFDAPRELVFEAWTHPNHLAHWWGPTGFTITTSKFDFRPGGEWRLVMHGPNGRDFQNRVTFDEIVAPERIAYHHGDGDDVEPIRFSTLVTFEDIGEGKTRLTMRMVFPSAELRDRVVREFGAAEGQTQTLTRLSEYISDWPRGGGLEKTIKLSRYLDAPRPLVFAAFTDPVHLAQWWGPKGFTNPVCQIDARPGGAILVHMQGPGDFSHPMTGTVHEVVPHERFVFTAVAEDGSHKALLEAYTVVTFADEGQGTRLTVEARAKGLAPIARMMLAGMQEGWSQSLEKLEALVTRRV